MTNYRSDLKNAKLNFCTRLIRKKTMMLKTIEKRKKQCTFTSEQK